MKSKEQPYSKFVGSQWSETCVYMQGIGTPDKHFITSPSMQFVTS
jgi:hypothetical protein